MNEQLVKVFRELSMYEARRNRPFPSKSFMTVANSIRSLEFELTDPEDIKFIKGVGSSSEIVIREWLKNGSSNRHQQAVKEMGGVDELAQINGIGAVKAARLNAVGIYSVHVLREAVKGLKYGDEIAGSGVNFLKMMEIGLEFEAHTDKTRMTVEQHDEIAVPMMESLRKEFGVMVDTVGSRRRWNGVDRNYTIGDIDIIVGRFEPGTDFHKGFEKYLDKVIMSGPAKVSGIKNRRQVDIRFINPECWGAMLLHGTGSMKFNIKLRVLAMGKGMVLSEYGLKKDGAVIASKTEEEIFSALGIPFVAPWDRSIK